MWLNVSVFETTHSGSVFPLKKKNYSHPLQFKVKRVHVVSLWSLQCMLGQVSLPQRYVNCREKRSY